MLKSWMMTHDKAPIARALGDAYFRGWSRLVESQYERSEVRVCCLAEEPGAIIGFAVIGKGRDVVHYVSVRQTWRRKGIAKRLLGPELSTDRTIKFTHTPPPFIAIPKGWVYDPLLGAGLGNDK